MQAIFPQEYCIRISRENGAAQRKKTRRLGVLAVLSYALRQGRQNLTRYHLDSRAKKRWRLPRQCAHWLAMTFFLPRLSPPVTGRTRGSLRIENPAPRPCSSAFFRAHFQHNRALCPFPAEYSSFRSFYHMLDIIAQYSTFCQAFSSFRVSHMATAMALIPPTSLPTIIAPIISGANPAVKPR